MLGRAMHAARPRLAAARAAPRVPLDARLRHGPAPALPFGAQPQQPQQPPPIADVRMAPCRASSSGSDSDGDGPARNTRLQQRLREDGQHARRGFERLRVRGDGACMFRSVAQGDALLRSGRLLPEQHEWEAAQQLRADVVKQLHASRSDIEPFIPGIVDGVESFDSYLARMARPGTWGGEPELAMAVKVLQRPIAVYSPSPFGPEHIITYGEEYSKEPSMHVLWSGNHYDLLIPAGTPRSKL